GTTRVGVLRVVRESRLATEESGVAAEQLVVVAEWVVLLAVLSGEGELLRADDPGDPLAPHSCVVDDAEVVGGTHHALGVQSGGAGGTGVQRAELCGPLVHQASR